MQHRTVHEWLQFTWSQTWQLYEIESPFATGNPGKLFYLTITLGGVLCRLSTFKPRHMPAVGKGAHIKRPSTNLKP
jgi:hypothetical protein